MPRTCMILWPTHGKLKISEEEGEQEIKEGYQYWKVEEKE